MSIMVSAIIVAGGKGIRMGGSVRKQYLTLGGCPILEHAVRAFATHDEIGRIFLVVPEEDADFCQENILSPLKLGNRAELVSGGKERQDSVYNGLLAVEERDDIVMIHDGVRPFVRHEQITACISGVREAGACIAGIPASDTLKYVNPSGHIEKTLPREGVWLAQTPQAFRHDLILNAHEAARRDGYAGTDDASLVERMGKRVKLITGSRFNMKITTPEDLGIAEAILLGETKFFQKAYRRRIL